MQTGSSSERTLTVIFFVSLRPNSDGVARGEPFPWPVLLHREGSNKNHYETWTPKPDFSMLVDGYPRVIIQVCSDPDNQSDLWRLLLSAASILRTLYEFRVNSNTASPELFRSSIMIAYIKNGRAAVHILYLVPRLDSDADVSYILII